MTLMKKNRKKKIDKETKAHIINTIDRLKEINIKGDIELDEKIENLKKKAKQIAGKKTK